jgi:hypothetical protein
MAANMNFRGFHRKYIEGTSKYEVYVYGDVVERNGKTYICTVPRTSGYVPEDAKSGFTLLAFYEDPSPNTGGFTGEIGGGTY